MYFFNKKIIPLVHFRLMHFDGHFHTVMKNRPQCKSCKRYSYDHNNMNEVPGRIPYTLNTTTYYVYGLDNNLFTTKLIRMNKSCSSYYDAYNQRRIKVEFT